MSIRHGPIETKGPLTIPTTGTLTTFFKTGGADYLTFRVWGGVTEVLDIFTIVFSPDGINSTPVAVPAALFAHNPPGTTMVLDAVITNPSTFFIYPVLGGARNISFFDYIGLTMSTTTVDSTGVMISCQANYIVDIVG